MNDLIQWPEQCCSLNSQEQYTTWLKPSWAPDTWVFGTVWSILYTIIAIVMIVLIVKIVKKKLPWTLIIPFGLNILFNAVFTYIQFWLGSFQLAFIDILLVLITIIWSMIAVWKHQKWMTIAYIPYLVRVSIATVLQYQTMMLNTQGFIM